MKNLRAALAVLGAMLVCFFVLRTVLAAQQSQHPRFHQTVEVQTSELTTLLMVNFQHMEIHETLHQLPEPGEDLTRISRVLFQNPGKWVCVQTVAGDPPKVEDVRTGKCPQDAPKLVKWLGLW